MAPEVDALIGSFRHMRDYARHEEALHALRRIASMVKPIMRARLWRVGELCEFYPLQANLLGLNENRGQRIYIRLRHPNDRNQFLPFESVVDTMLHELCHNVHGPHDQKFHALWNQLREELDGLIMKGYTGEGFLGQGHQLGGYRIPALERQRQARADAERHKPPPPRAPGIRLGGSRPQPGDDIRSVIVRSVESRNNMHDQNCANQNKNEAEIREISEQWRRNGFRTQAEEEAANDAAIAQALWELVQEDKKREYGDWYIPPSSQNPTGNGGGSVIGGSSNSSSSSSSRGQLTEYYAPPAPAAAPPPRPPPVPYTTRPPPPTPPPQPTHHQPAAPSKSKDYWACNLCTLHNPLHATSCEVCGTPGPVMNTPLSRSGGGSGSGSGSRDVIDLTSSPQTKKRVNFTPSTKSSSRQGSSSTTSYTAPPPQSRPATWSCSYCGKLMESQWWICSMCGIMKDKS